MALIVTPFFLAIFQSESPLTTTYSEPAVSGTIGGWAMAGGWTGGLEASTGGGLVFIIAVSFVSSAGGFSTSVCSRLQPCMSRAMRPTTLMASTQNTATLTRERRLLCSSNKEPWGTNGLGLFIDLALIASFRDEDWVVEFPATKPSSQKLPGVLNHFCSSCYA